MNERRSGDSGQVFMNYLVHINKAFHVIIDGTNSAVHLVLQRPVRKHFKMATDEASTM